VCVSVYLSLGGLCAVTVRRVIATFCLKTRHASVSTADAFYVTRVTSLGEGDVTPSDVTRGDVTRLLLLLMLLLLL